ncbi:alpha/beta fold hydrolase [Erysipelothrix larvae]|nr:alpha/beta hydrolase [Erysipelothrix larvae]
MLIVITMYLVIQAIRCHNAVKESRKTLTTYQAESVSLSYGNLTYVDKGVGEVILSVHGLFGGYDQAFDTCKDLSSDYRIIAPSRFGYVGSDILGSGTPGEQATAFVELLDRLKIEKVFLLGTSAGGSVSIRFALDYPHRTKGLILYCSGMHFSEKPHTYPEYAGPPAFLCNNFAMYVISPFFEPIMGMHPSTINSMLPIGDRKDGVILDASVTNPDMARNFENYHIESLQVPTLIFHAIDDKLVRYEDTLNALNRFPNCTFISFETGGHLMDGHAKEIETAVAKFIH